MGSAADLRHQEGQKDAAPGAGLLLGRKGNKGGAPSTQIMSDDTPVGANNFSVQPLHGLREGCVVIGRTEGYLESRSSPPTTVLLHAAAPKNFPRTFGA